LFSKPKYYVVKETEENCRRRRLHVLTWNVWTSWMSIWDASFLIWSFHAVNEKRWLSLSE
jgi:hypothetical protein